MNTLTHRGYSARVEFDDEDGLFFGKVAEIYATMDTLQLERRML